MPTIRFNVSKELNDMLTEIKGNVLKVPYSTVLFEKAVIAEYKKQQQKKGGSNEH